MWDSQSNYKYCTYAELWIFPFSSTLYLHYSTIII